MKEVSDSELVEKALVCQATDLQELNLHEGGRTTKEFNLLREHPEAIYSRTEVNPTGRFYRKNAEYGKERIDFYLVKKS